MSVCMTGWVETPRCCFHTCDDALSSRRVHVRYCLHTLVHTLSPWEWVLRPSKHTLSGCLRSAETTNLIRVEETVSKPKCLLQLKWYVGYSMLEKNTHSLMVSLVTPGYGGEVEESCGAAISRREIKIALYIDTANLLSATTNWGGSL